MGATHNDRKFRGFEPRWPSQVFALLLAFQSFVLPSLAQAAAERLPTSSNTSTSTSTGTATFTAPPPATANQSGLQQNTGNSNKLASILSTGLGVLSMAAGGLAVAGGAAQLSCCSSGCPPGSGFRALSSFLGLGQAANNATPGVANAAGTGSSSATPAAAAAPAGAEGAGAGCYVDGAFSLAAGGLMLLNGIAAQIGRAHV